MIDYIIVLCIWSLFGILFFNKVTDMNKEINPIKMNFLIIISGPLVWVLKLGCFITIAFIFIGKIMNKELNNFCMWFGE